MNNCPKCLIPLTKGLALIQQKVSVNSFRYGTNFINDYSKVTLINCNKCHNCGYSTI